MKEKVVMIRATVLKRIGAFLIDFFIFIVLLCLAFSFIFGPIFDSTGKVKTLKQDYYTVAMESGIYQGKNFNDLSYIDEDYDHKINLFYEKYDKIETYNKLKSEQFSKYFAYDEVTDTFSETKSEEEMKVVYRQILSAYCNKVLYDNNVEFKKLSDSIVSFQFIELTLAFTLSGIICYIVLPLVFKDGQTLAKKILRLQVVSLKGDYHCSWAKVVLRYLVFILIELAFNLATSGLVFIASFIVTIFTKNNQSFHDLVASTTVVDLSYLPNEENTKKQVELEEIVETEIVQQTEEEN